jgi:translocation protein SEC63
VSTDGEVSRFDPYAILGVEKGAAVKVIQKAYRKLSLAYHPDKNKGDKAAEEMFMKVARAYESLTDEVARKNFEEFGNPDGKQALEVSIGLPSWLLENPKVVLVIYLLAIVLVIPVGVGLWYSQSKQYGEKNIKYESYTAFYQFISENHRVKMFPEVLATSAEFRERSPPKQSDREGLNKLLGKLKVEKLMQKPKFEHPVIMKGNLLLHAHALRLTSMLTPDLKKDLDNILFITPELCDAMVEIAYQRRWLQTTLSAITFSQSMIQALWDQSPLLQLPHLTESEIKHIPKSSKSTNTMIDYLKTPDDQKKGLAHFTDEQKNEVFAACKAFPQTTVELKLFVEEDEEEEDAIDDDDDDAEEGKGAVVPRRNALVDGAAIYEGDVVTLRVTVTRENVPEGEDCPPVYAPRFPRAVREAWWFVLADRPKADPRSPGTVPQSRIHTAEKNNSQNRVVVHNLHFQAPPTAGSYAMDLHLLCDSYLGLDSSFEVKFDVLPASSLPEYIPHPEDADLDADPTLFEQMLTGNVDEGSDDEEDDAAADGSGESDEESVEND